jgi:hypothetical protein
MPTKHRREILNIFCWVKLALLRHRLGAAAVMGITEVFSNACMLKGLGDWDIS